MASLKGSSSGSEKLGDPEEYEGFLKQISHPDSTAFAAHFIESVVDEIALEGLDGITLQALKLRLTDRPNLEIENFEDVAPAIWNQMRLLEYLSFYYLPHPRPDLRSYAWDKIRDERGSPYEPFYTPDEIYPYFPVEDKERGIRGSCEQFKGRTDISHIARRITYQDAIKHFGNHLVIVADQIVREKALFGENYKKHSALSIVQYCIMERVGRARHAGETTRGKISLQCLNIQPKTLFYNRKALLKAGIVTRQAASMKFANCKCPAAITVFHLPRFYRRIESMANLNMRQIFSYMNNSSTKSIPVETIVSKYGKHTLRNILIQFPTLIETKFETEKLLEFEEGDDELGLLEKKRKPRTIKVLRFKVTDVNTQNQVMKRVLEGETGQEEEAQEAADDDKEEKVDVNSPNSFADIKALRSEHTYSNINDSCRLYRALIRAGTAGLKQMDLTFLKLTNLEARSATRFLARHNLCKEGVLKMQKQKAYTYTFCRFVDQKERIKLTLQDEYTEVLEKIKTLRRAIYDQKLGRAMAVLGESPIVCDQNVEKDNSQEPNENESLPSSKDEVSPPKKSKPSSKSKKKKQNASNIDNEVPTSKTQPALSPKVKKSKTTTTDIEERSKVLTKAIENMPAPTLCLVKSEVDLSSAFEEHPSIVISTGPPYTPSTALPPNLEQPVQSQTVDEVPETLEENEVCSEPENDDKSLSKFDPIDEEIRRGMLRQRVDWNDRDDRFILLAFIASILFIPKYNFSRIFIFNSIQIRNLMLKKSGKASNKTSSAIRRRVHFLMHQKDKYFYKTWVAFLNAAVRDEELYHNLIKHHLQPPQQKIYLDISNNALENVYDYLVEKFDRISNYSSIVDAPGDLSNIETLLFLRQLKRVEFYWHAMMFIIFCPFGNTTASRRRFKVFWKDCLNNKIKLNVETSEVEGRKDPLAEIAEEEDEDIDIEELEEEEKDDDAKTPEELCSDYVFRFLRFLAKNLKILFANILMLGSTSKKKFQLVTFDRNCFNTNICNSTRECNSNSEIRLWSGRSLVLDLVFSGDPSNIVGKPILKKVKLPIERAVKSLTHAKILVFRKHRGLLGVSRKYLRQFICGLPSNAFDETLEFLEYIDEASNVDSLACISCGILFGIVELSDYFQPLIMMSEQVFTLNDEWLPVYDGITQEQNESGNKKSKKRKNPPEDEGVHEKMAFKRPRKELTEEEEEEIDDIYECFEEFERDMVVQRTSLSSGEINQDGKRIGFEEGESYLSSSKDALRLLRIRLNQRGVEMPGNFTGFVERDFFSINLPNLEFVFPKRQSLNLKILGNTRPFSEDCWKELRASLMELVYHLIPDEFGKDEDCYNRGIVNIENFLKRYKLLYEVINCAGCLGVSGAFLKSKFERKSLGKGLRYLLEAKLIFSVGVTHRRFVSYTNVYNWVIPIRKTTTDYKVGHVVLRPWITPLGALSRSTINRLFISLLGQLQRSEMAFDDLCGAFLPTLSRVEVMVLIEALVKLKFVTMYRLIEPKVTMFSKHRGSKTVIEYHADTLIDTNDVFVAVSPYTTFLHAQLQHSINSTRRSFSDQARDKN